MLKVNRVLTAMAELVGGDAAATRKDFDALNYLHGVEDEFGMIYEIQGLDPHKYSVRLRPNIKGYSMVRYNFPYNDPRALEIDTIIRTHGFSWSRNDP